MTSKQMQQDRAIRPEDRFPDFPPGTMCRTPSTWTTQASRPPCAATLAHNAYALDIPPGERRRGSARLQATPLILTLSLDGIRNH